MTPSFEQAHNVYGQPFKSIAFDVEVTEQTLWKWRTLRQRCPRHKRQTIDRVLKAKVDWEQYDREYDAANRPEPQDAQIRPLTPPKQIQPAMAQKTPTPPPAPEIDADADEFKELYG